MRRPLAVLLFIAAGVRADVVIEVPHEVSFFDAPAIRITGLPPTQRS